MKDKENRLRLFMADLQALLWQHDCELSVELDSDGRHNFDAELRVYWHYGTHDRLPTNIEGKEPTH